MVDETQETGAHNIYELNLEKTLTDTLRKLAKGGRLISEGGLGTFLLDGWFDAKEISRAMAK